MTNFEKWKQGLTPLDAWVFSNNECCDCPAVEYCHENEGNGCVKNFQEWANAEAEDAPLTSTVVWHKFPNDDYPHKCTDYLVVKDFGSNPLVCIEEWNESDNAWINDNDEVTHWAELPEPPKEKF